MNTFEKAVSFLPEGLSGALMRISPTVQPRIQEIRLRRGALLTVSLPEGEKTVESTGVLSDRGQALSIFCTGEDIEKTFLKLCDYSVHSHSAEVRNGFVTASGGFRAGIAGTAVVEDGQVTAVRDIRSICLRIAARHDGCAAQLRPLFSNGLRPMLILGEPSAGKTALLRDIGRMLSDGSETRRYRVAVVDERGEIAGAGGLENADILTGCPKAVGILQAVRTMAPDVILLDELGSLAEVEAMTENLHAGVPVIATAHCRTVEECLRRPAVRLALERQVFDTLIFLHGREVPGKIRQIVEVDSLEIRGHHRYCYRRTVDGCLGGGTVAPPRDSVGNTAVSAE